MRDRKTYYVYILASASRILYTGMTSELENRVWQHKSRLFESFTSHFKLCRLVYYESYSEVAEAITRERQIKRWRREKKIMLIEKVNRDWHDLVELAELDSKTKAEALSLDSPPQTRLARDDSSKRKVEARSVRDDA